MSRPTIAVVGAGLAGLSAAWHLRDLGCEPRVFERSARAGGVIGTDLVNGFRFERGPMTVPAAAPTLRSLIERCGLEPRLLISSRSAKRRYVWRDGALHPLPGSPAALLRSGLLAWRSKLRLLAEPFAAESSAARDETLAAFFARRLGRETVEAFARPLAHGVYAGRPEELGVDAFPRLRQWEEEHGSLLRALIAEQRKTSRSGEAPARDLISFPTGMQELAEALAAGLDGQIHLGREVTAVSPDGNGSLGWRIEHRAIGGGESASTPVDGVVLAVTAPAAATLLAPLGVPTAADLAEIPHAAVAVVGLGYRRDVVTHPLDGFGLLCADGAAGPSDERVLGVLFSSSIFAGRAPTGSVSLTVMLGGRRAPEVVTLDEAELCRRAHEACARYLGAKSGPVARSITRWPSAIPQYLPGHPQRIDALSEQVERCGSIRLAGSYLRGVGVEPTALSGAAAADELVGALT